MANIKTHDINKLEDWNAKELRKLRMTLNNRISSLQNTSDIKELSNTHPLFEMEISECKTLLQKVISMEKKRT